MSRKITRTWTTKAGITKTKTYDYTRKSRRGKVLVSKNGKINTKNIDEYKREIMANSEYTDAEKRALIADLNIITKQSSKSGTRLTTRGFEGKIATDAIDRMFINSGSSVEEVASWYGLDPADIRNKSNWSGNILIVGGVKYKFEHGYNNDILTLVP
jgi:hypothetical protein